MGFISDLLIEISSFRIRVGNKLNTLANRIGVLNNLTTTNKNDLVGAVNEVKEDLGNYLPLVGGTMSANAVINWSGAQAFVQIGGISKLRFSSTITVLSSSVPQGGSYGIYLRPQGDTQSSGQVIIDGNGQINTSNHGNSSQWKQAYDWGNFKNYGLGVTSQSHQATLDGDIPSSLYTFSTTSQTVGAPYDYGGVLTIRRGSNEFVQLALPVQDTTNKPPMYRGRVSTGEWAWRKFITEVNLDTEVTALGFIKSSEFPTNYITTNTTQTGLSGNKTTSGVWNFAGSAATSINVIRTSALNSSIGYGVSNSVQVYAGLANSSAFAIGSSADIDNINNRWMWVANNGTVYAKGNVGGTQLGSRDIGGFTIGTSTNTSKAEMILRHVWTSNNTTYGLGGTSSPTSGSMSNWGMYRWLNDRTTNGNDGFFGWIGDSDQLIASSLSGSGNRMVIANSAGVLSTQAIPTNTTYSAGTLALLQAGTNTTNRVWSAQILAQRFTEVNRRIVYYRTDDDNVDSDVQWGTNIIGGSSIQVQGGRNIVKGQDINIFGNRNVSSGINNQINGFANVANGAFNTINGAYSSIAGSQSNTIGNYLFARDNQTVLGMYNKVYNVGDDEGLRVAFGTGSNDFDKFNAVEIYDDHRTEFHGKAAYDEETRNPEWFTEDYTHVDTYQVGYDHLTHRASSSTPCEHNIFEVAVRGNERFARVDNLELAFNIHGIVKGNLVESNIDRTKVHTNGTLEFSNAVRLQLLEKADISKNPYLVVEYNFVKEEIYVKYVGSFYIIGAKSQVDKVLYILGNFINKRGPSGQPDITYFEFNQQII